SAWVLTVILAVVWGGPYDCRFPLSHDYALALHPVGSEYGKDTFGDEVDTSLSSSAALQSEYASLMTDLNLGDFDIIDPMVSTVVPRLPETISELEGDERKKAFIGLILPTVMVALDEVRQERQMLMAIVAELGGEKKELLFSEEHLDWQYQLGSDKAKFILGLTKKYRTTSAQELVDMVNVLPPSLILAQGAIESGWGSSRMAVNSNNLFGMYSNITSSTSGGSASFRSMEYDSILDSVRAYILNLNRQSAYKELREIRLQTLDPLRIAEGLTKYSERKWSYISDLKLIIVFNRLQHYDSLIPAAG
ncbi:MAG: glucosaminidase domain-containing protein, partial [Desulfobulbaceae bacterium]|nr:glucosaminidase domain-containing protein [Desulfobulbaceae bacterium]